MIFRQAICAILALAFLTACADDGRIRGRDVGMVGGAVGGAIAGQAIGGADPTARVLGTIAGVIIGAAAGGYLGSLWDDYDRRQASYALENNPDRRPATWRNPNTNSNATVTPTRTYYEPDGSPCREFTQTIYIDGKKEVGRGTACRQADGTWRVNSYQ
ncbi:MAG: RT0821/Lpp0805 family surface protein [Thermodesulfobacteriota bacterium]